MTNAQKLALRLSEIKQRLNEIAGLEGEALTPEVRAEADRLQAEYPDAETRWRSAYIAEGEAEAEALGKDGNGDGQPAEVRGLMRRASVADYMAAAAAGVPLSGAAAELNAALEIRSSGPVEIPLAFLADGVEDRATVTGDAASTTTALAGQPTRRPILRRLFGRSILAPLGVRLDSVPSGQTEWPLLTAGTAIAQKDEGTARDAATAPSFDTEALKPKRLTGAFIFTGEQMLQIGPDLEASLRRDLADAAAEQMSRQVLTGTGANGQVTGINTRIASATNAGADDEATYAVYAGLHALGVDGIHAAAETEVSSIIGVATYQHAATKYADQDGEAATEALTRRSAGCFASPFIGAVASNRQDAILHAGMDAARGDSIAAVWPSMQIIRDIYSQAEKGQVILTWVQYWDCYVALRLAAYKRLSIKVST